MNFINEENEVLTFDGFVDDTFNALLEITTEFSAGDHRTEVDLINFLSNQITRHLIFGDTSGEAFNNGGLTHTSFTN